MRHRMKICLKAGSILTAIACLTAPSLSAMASSYPDRSVSILVGYPPGGASDTVARLLAQQLEAINGQTFIVENKPGVGGMLSLGSVAKSNPNGYILGLGVSGTLVTGPHLQKNQLYNPRTDFAPVGMVAKVPMVLLAGPSFKAKSVADLIKEAKDKPGEIMFASGAQAFELALRLLNSEAQIQLTSVAYKGGAGASIDVMAGRVPIMVDSIGAQKSNIEGGKLRALAVLDSTRSPLMPDVPTMAEAGLPNYEAVGWISLLAPKGTPGHIVEKLNTQLHSIVNSPEFADKLTALGFEPTASSPAELQATIESEYEKWGEVVRNANIQPQ